MHARSIQRVVLLICAGVTQWLACSGGNRVVDLGFWFEPVSFHADGIDPPLSAGDISVIDATARAELAHAFSGLRIRVTDHRDARFSVRVVPEVTDLIYRTGVAGASRAISGFGGNGAVSFTFAANGAMSHASPEVTRDEIIRAIGRGIGRTAVHEFAHQLLPTSPLHDSQPLTYESEGANGWAHYYGELKWDIAKPLLQQRFAHP
jgi:hypothetical protein